MTFWVSGQYTTDQNFSVYEFDNKIYQGPKYFLTENDLDLELLSQNQKNLVYPWDDVPDLGVLGSIIPGMYLQNYPTSLRIN